MRGFWISAATIARFAVAGSLMTLMAGGHGAPKAARTIVEQTSYFALAGKAEDVYRVRLHASDVLEKLRRSTSRLSPARPCSSPPGKLGHLPGVMWLVEYPDEAGHQRSLKTRLESPEFKAVRNETKTLISHADLGIWEQN
jgi:hypothetical protein